MYRVDRNNFYQNAKDSTVYTPSKLSDFLFSIFDGHIDQRLPVIDPCVGAGSLLQPFERAGYQTIGIDSEDQGFPETIQRNFLAINPGEFGQPSLVIANPPFNIDDKTKALATQIGGGRPLLPEVWLRKILHIWGDAVPICLFAPYGLRLNQTCKSKRWQAFVTGAYPEISSIVALPKDIYEGVLFHSEVLIFNVAGIKPHYFYTG